MMQGLKVTLIRPRLEYTSYVPVLKASHLKGGTPHLSIYTVGARNEDTPSEKFNRDHLFFLCRWECIIVFMFTLSNMIIR